VSLTDDGNFEGEHLDGFSNVVTNGSTGVVIGGSCSGVAMICFCVLIYFLYTRLRQRIDPIPDRSTEPKVIHVREAEEVANPNGALCQCCRNVPSSAHFAWSQLEFPPMGECICMSAPPPYSKH